MALLNPVDRPLCSPVISQAVLTPFAAGEWPSPDLRELPIAVLWVRAVEAFAVSIRNTRSIEEKEHEAESFEK